MFKHVVHALFWSALVLMIGVVPLQAQDITNDDCADCHTDSDEETAEVSVDHLLGSIHEDLDCLECHIDIVELPHDDIVLQPAACVECHDDVVDDYKVHGRGVVGESKYIPTCSDCHGTHDILPAEDLLSLTNPMNLAGTCATCHEDSTLVADVHISFKHPIRVYTESVHGKKVAGEMHTAAGCKDCHGYEGNSHQILPAGDMNSTIAHRNIHKTCGECHASIADDFIAGIHGQLLLEGEVDTPTCTTCHGEHGILSSQDPRSPVSPARVAEATCTPCHESAALNERYELPTGKIQSYVDSYHGLKSQAGDKTVANCASCHGAHLILASNDPKSTVHADNLQKTCGECHHGITADVARRPIHETATDHKSGLAHIVKIIYLGLIFSVIGGMAFHWAIDWIKQARDVLRKTPQVRRMEPNEVFQHTMLAVSFTSLVITGFSLRFYDAWWSQLLFGHEGGYAIRGFIHRGSAVMMIFGSFWHLFYVILTHRGREFIRDMAPTMLDATQAFQKMGYNLGIVKKAPEFLRFSYVEKAEYWALIWGTIVMVLTGFALWFDNTVMHWISPELLDTMLVVHYYEAWLAFLAIVVWHMYGVMFNPEVYPMNPSWISGKMPEDMYKHEHGAVKLVEHRHVVRTRVRAEGTTMEGREKVDDSTRRD